MQLHVAGRLPVVIFRKQNIKIVILKFYRKRERYDKIPFNLLATLKI